MIVFFDGVCGLCNRAVDVLLALDKHERLLLAPLQGMTAFKRLPAADTQNLNSLVIVDGDIIYRKSEGLLRVAAELGGGWRILAGALRLIPRPLRDLIYDVVAANRFAIFGRRDSCRRPTPEERRRFLE